MNFTHELSNLSNPVNNSTNNVPVTFIYLIFHYINVALGFPIHFYIVWLICTGKGSGIVAEFFNLNLTVCEILFCLCSVLFIASIKFPTLTPAAYFFFAQPGVGRPLINCFICIERYLAVLYPVSFLKYKPLRYKLVCSAVIWVTVLVFCVFCMFALPNNLHLFISVYLPLYTLLLFIKLFCFVAILKALRNPSPGEKKKEKEKANIAKQKAMSVILIITVIMLIKFTPLFLVGTLYRTLSAAYFNLLWCIVVILAFVLSYVSPVMYIYKVRTL